MNLTFYAQILKLGKSLASNDCLTKSSKIEEKSCDGKPGNDGELTVNFNSSSRLLSGRNETGTFVSVTPTGEKADKGVIIHEFLEKKNQDFASGQTPTNIKQDPERDGDVFKNSSISNIASNSSGQEMTLFEAQSETYLYVPTNKIEPEQTSSAGQENVINSSNTEEKIPVNELGDDHELSRNSSFSPGSLSDQSRNETPKIAFISSGNTIFNEFLVNPVSDSGFQSLSHEGQETEDDFEGCQTLAVKGQEVEGAQKGIENWTLSEIVSNSFGHEVIFFELPTSEAQTLSGLNNESAPRNSKNERKPNKKTSVKSPVRKRLSLNSSSDSGSTSEEDCPSPPAKSRKSVNKRQKSYKTVGKFCCPECLFRSDHVSSIYTHAANKHYFVQLAELHKTRVMMNDREFCSECPYRSIANLGRYVLHVGGKHKRFNEFIPPDLVEAYNLLPSKKTNFGYNQVSNVLDLFFHRH